MMILQIKTRSNLRNEKKCHNFPVMRTIDYRDGVLVIGNDIGEISFLVLDKWSYKPKLTLLRVIAPPSNDITLQVAITCLKLSPCKRFLCVGTINGTILVFELGGDSLMKIVYDHDEHAGGTISSIAWSANSCKVYSGCENGQVVELVCDQKETNSTLSFTKTFFGNLRTRVIYKSVSSITQITTSIKENEYGLLDVLCIWTSNKCIIFEFPHKQEADEQAYELAPSPTTSTSFRNPSNITLLGAITYSGSDRGAEVVGKVYPHEPIVLSVYRSNHHDLLQVAIHSLRDDRSTNYILQTSERLFTPFSKMFVLKSPLSNATATIGLTADGHLMLVSTLSTSIVAIPEVGKVRCLAACGDTCMVLHENGDISLLCCISAMSTSPPILVTQSFLSALCSVQRLWRRKKKLKFTPINTSSNILAMSKEADSKPLWRLDSMMMKTTSHVKDQVNQRLSSFPFGSQLTASLKWMSTEKMISSKGPELKPERGISPLSAPLNGLANARVGCNTGLGLGKETSETTSRDLKLSSPIKASEAEAEADPPDHALSPVSFAESPVAAFLTYTQGESANGDISEVRSDLPRNREETESANEGEASDGMTEGEGEDDDGDGDGDGGLWCTVGEVSWRERWWQCDAGGRSVPASDLDLPVRYRLSSKRRQRSSPRTPEHIPVLPLPQHDRRQHMPSRASMGTMKPDSYSLQPLPPNTYELTLFPTAEYGIGLRLSIVGAGCVIVSGFVRNRKGTDVREDCRGAAERSGLVAAGDVLIAFGDVYLPSLGLEGILEILQDLDATREKSVRLRFLYGDETTVDIIPRPLPASLSLSPSDDGNPLLDVFQLDRGRRKQNHGTDDPATLPLGLRTLNAAASWLEGDVDIFVTDLPDVADDWTFSATHLTDAVMFAVKRRSIYPSVYPTPCMQQRGEASFSRISKGLADEARPWLLSRFPYMGSGGARFRALKRRRTLESSKDDWSTRVGVLHRDHISASQRCIRRLVKIARNRISKRQEEGILIAAKLRGNSKDVESVSGSWITCLDKMEPLMSVVWTGQCVEQNSSCGVVPDVDALLDDLHKSFGPSTRQSPSTATTTSKGSWGPLKLPPVISNLPDPSITTNITKIILSRGINVLQDANIWSLLQQWLESFRPLPMTQWETVHPKVINSAVSASFGAASPRGLNETLVNTELLITLVFLLGTCRAYLRLAPCSNCTEGPSPRSICERGLSALGLAISCSSRNENISIEDASAFVVWRDVDACKYLHKYGAYIHVDSVVAACNAMGFEQALTIAESLASLDTDFRIAETELIQGLRKDPRPMDAHQLLSHVIEAYGMSFSKYLSLFQSCMRFVFVRDVNLGIQCCVTLSPLIRPWNIRRVLSMNPYSIEMMQVDSKITGLDMNVVAVQYILELINRFPCYSRDTSFIAESLTFALSVTKTSSKARVSAAHFFDNIVSNPSNFSFDTREIICMCDSNGYFNGIFIICQQQLLQHIHDCRLDTLQNEERRLDSDRSSALGLPEVKAFLARCIYKYMRKFPACEEVDLAFAIRLLFVTVACLMSPQGLELDVCVSFARTLEECLKEASADRQLWAVLGHALHAGLGQDRAREVLEYLPAPNRTLTTPD